MSYDLEQAVVTVTNLRRRRDEMSRQVVMLGDQLATSVAGDLPSEMFEAAGAALIHSSARLGGLLEQVRPGVERDQQNLATVLINIQSVAGERLVRDGRALDQVPVT